MACAWKYHNDRSKDKKKKMRSHGMAFLRKIKVFFLRADLYVVKILVVQQYKKGHNL